MAKILIVDDNESFAKSLKRLIKNIYGYESDIKTNPVEALEDFKSNSYRLIFSDTEMPQMLGYDFAVKVREYGKEVQIIGMSGKDEYKEIWEKIGCKFVYKPCIAREIDEGELSDIIKNIE